MICTPSALAAAAACFDCALNQKQIRAIRTYLLCRWAFVETCTGPQAPDNLSVVGTTTSSITFSWAQPLSIPPVPVGSYIIRWGSSTGNYELGTATVSGATFSYTITGLSASETVYVVVQAIGADGCPGGTSDESAFTSQADACVNADSALWAANFAAADPGAPPAGEEDAVCVFANAIGSLKARMVLVGPIAPGNFPGGSTGGPRTALYCGSSCVWGGANVNAGGSVNGLSASAIGNRWFDLASYDTASALLNINNSGFSIYMPITPGIGNFLDFGAFSGTNGFYAGLNNNLGTVFTIGLVALQAVIAYPGPGFFSFNRTASNVLKVYWGNDTNPIAQIGATVIGDNTTGAFPTGTSDGHYYLGAVNQSGVGAITITNNTYSYISIHDGFSLADVQQEFAAVTAMRHSFGGGTI